jgi:hypothetical protein
MPWGELLILDAVVIIAVLIYYRNRPKPRWLRAEIRVAVWVARALRIIRRVAAPR